MTAIYEVLLETQDSRAGGPHLRREGAAGGWQAEGRRRRGRGVAHLQQRLLHAGHLQGASGALGGMRGTPLRAVRPGNLKRCLTPTALSTHIEHHAAHHGGGGRRSRRGLQQGDLAQAAVQVHRDAQRHPRAQPALLPQAHRCRQSCTAPARHRGAVAVTTHRKPLTSPCILLYNAASVSSPCQTPSKV